MAINPKTGRPNWTDERFIQVLKEFIIPDLICNCDEIKSIWIIGSFAKGNAKHSSDVDLLIDYDNDVKTSEKVYLNFAKPLSKILDHQFNRELDIVCYETAQKRARVEPNDINWYDKKGYEEMLKDKILLFTRGDDIEKSGVVEENKEEYPVTR